MNGSRVPTAEEREEHKAHLGLVTSIATRLKGQLGLLTEVDELVASGFKGLVEARSRFDASRNIPFEAYAYYRIRGAMIDNVRATAQLSRRAHARLAALEALNQGGEAASDADGTDPRETYVALNMAVQAAGAAYTVASGVTGTLSVNEDQHPDAVYSTKERSSLVQQALAALDERERAFVTRHYFNGERFDAVAESLGISKSWGCRIHLRALTKLKEALANLGAEPDAL